MVIDIREDLLEKSNDEVDKYFGIGHSLSKSETFLPVFYRQNDKKVTWTDVAGLNDSGGDLISFINSFVTKQLFCRAS